MSIKQKILLISLRSDMGGGPRHMADLLKFIKGNHPEIEVFTASPKDPPYYNFFHSDFEHLELPHRSFSIIRFFKLLSFVKKHQIDVIHTHGRGAGIYGGLLAWFGYYVIHTFHGIDQESVMKRMIEKLFSSWIGRFIAVSDSEKEVAIKLNIAPENKITVVKNGIDLVSNFSPKTITPGQPLIMGTLARFDPIKNLEQLIEYFSKLPPRLNLKLKIAGPGDQESCRKLIKNLGADDRIELVGAVNEPNKFLEQLTLYVTASKREGLPYAVLEAMAAKLPIVASDVTGHQDLLESECRYSLNNPEDFIAKVKLAVDHLSKGDHSIVLKNFQKLQESHDLQKQLGAVTDLYQSH